MEVVNFKSLAGSGYIRLNQVTKMVMSQCRARLNSIRSLAVGQCAVPNLSLISGTVAMPFALGVFIS